MLLLTVPAFSIVSTFADLRTLRSSCVSIFPFFRSHLLRSALAWLASGRSRQHARLAVLPTVGAGGEGEPLQAEKKADATAINLAVQASLDAAAHCNATPATLLQLLAPLLTNSSNSSAAGTLDATVLVDASAVVQESDTNDSSGIAGAVHLIGTLLAAAGESLPGCMAAELAAGLGAEEQVGTHFCFCMDAPGPLKRHSSYKAVFGCVALACIYPGPLHCHLFS